MRTPFTDRVVLIVRRIPRGRVASYGQIAAMAGSPSGARQVARLLHSLSEVEGLPWHRVINSRGTISLPGLGGEIQRGLLEHEGVEFGLGGVVDLERCGWRPRRVPR
jgi:methylated-DNA-protein-cysteine methyltransferase-like protein